MMRGKFLAFLKDRHLKTTDETILLAVSGGIDSVVMVHLFGICKIKFEIAHCNFKLRGNDSENDEKFVRELAKQYNVPFHAIQFDTLTYAKENHLSIQQAARDLRYKWFRELARKHHFQAIATAHHLDDAIESFFINMIRGSGIKGLLGIPLKQGNIIRPMMFATRKEIENYARLKKITWREDQSNDGEYYLRNKIRHKVLPLMHEIQPQFHTIMMRNMQRLSVENEIIQFFIKSSLYELVKMNPKDELRINIERLQQSAFSEYLLNVILEPYGFASKQIQDIWKSIEKQSGKIFENANYRLVRDRTEFILYQKTDAQLECPLYYLSLEKKAFTFKDSSLQFKLKFSSGSITNKFRVDTSEDTAQLDYDKLDSTLVLRKWMKGDTIYPLGMKGKKKLSDLLTDLKVPLHEKENIWVLCSGEEIIWILGIKISDRFKIIPKSKKYLKISLLYT